MGYHDAAVQVVGRTTLGILQFWSLSYKKNAVQLKMVQRTFSRILHGVAGLS